MTNIVRYAQGTSFRGPSERVWGDLGQWRSKVDRGEGMLIWDDFVLWNASTTSGTSHQGLGWTAVTENGPIFNQVAAPTKPASGVGGEFGVLLLETMDTDNDWAYLTSSVTGTQFVVDDECKKLAFECRIKKSSIANANLTFFAGLASVGAAVDGTLVDDAGTLIASKSFLGYNQSDTDGDAINAVVQEASQTQQTPLSTAIAMEADTWIKLGFLYEPGNVNNVLRFFSNGAEQALSTKFKKGDLDDADFPNDVGMSVLLGFLVEGTGDPEAEIDWVCAGQQY